MRACSSTAAAAALDDIYFNPLLYGGLMYAACRHTMRPRYACGTDRLPPTLLFPFWPVTRGYNVGKAPPFLAHAFLSIGLCALDFSHSSSGNNNGKGLATRRAPDIALRTLDTAFSPQQSGGPPSADQPRGPCKLHNPSRKPGS